ncbi:hypothetical protein SKAU_G00304050 [Synaphobranchus kaupii]|uniref:MICOS complex subunit MIC25 n=1 Tax=Synaphobranchus kaupii TaxID=118154 RepID=A0A9Q1IML1_SYNKA|nr:hypothetical protein SKAU_G00304050 [Synaphobranchus kaupii]
MGSTESSTRKVSFALDEEDNVRILHGVKLSEDVLQRMRGVTRETDFRPPPAESRREEPVPKPVYPDPPQPSQPPQPSEAPSEPPRRFDPPRPSEPPQPSVAEIQEELRRRYEREQAIMREELARITRREREAAREELRAAMRRERSNTHTEVEKAKNLAGSFPAPPLDDPRLRLDGDRHCSGAAAVFSPSRGTASFLNPKMGGASTGLSMTHRRQ